MSKEAFVKFYQEYLPKNQGLQSKIDKITNEDQFAAAVLAEGPKAGFSFDRADVDAVMKASEQRVKGAELSDDQLGAVTGGAGVSIGSATVQIRSVDSVANITNRLQIPNLGAEGTVMCCW
nr:hypothetical protein Hi04_10k_c5591_00005 [uncultured bacterium]